MEYSAVKEMLKGLCHERWGWSYAVLWKPKCDNPIMLVWEDGYCRPGFVDMSYEWDALWRKSGDPLCQQRGHGGSLEILVFRLMFNQVHALGDGIVGRAASVGVHEWILQTVQAGNKSVLVNDDLQLQFSAGIQTIVVIPVLPHGVLQLGSNRMIMENYGFVNQLKGLFLHLRAAPGCPATTNSLLDQSKQKKQESFAGKKIFNSSSEVLGMSHLDCYTNCQKISKAEVQNQRSPSLHRHVYGNTQYTASMQSLSPSLDSLMLARHPSGPSLQQTVLLTNNHPSETFLGTETLISEVIESSPQMSDSVRVSSVDNYVDARVTRNCNSGSYKVAAWTSVQGPPSPSAGDSRCSMQPDCFTGAADSFCSNPSYCHKNDNDLFQALGIIPFASDEHISSKCQSLYHDSFPIKSAASENATPYSTREMKFEAQVSTHASGDLFDALHVKVKRGKFCGNSNSADTSILEHYTNDGDVSGTISTCMSGLSQPLDECNDSHADTMIPSSAESESLLDAVVWKINSNAKQKSEGDVVCCTELTGTTSCSGQANTIPYNQRPSPQKVQEEQLHMAPPVLASKLIQAGSSFDSVHYTNNTDKTLPVERKFTNPVKSFIEDDKSPKQNSISTGNSVRPSEMGKLNRKRTRPGEGSRPRPKDRQMIQDRLRDLREIIPNGAKYSIDALLERTIKHMLFLQSVTKHAEKIKQSGEWKGRDGGLPLKDNFEVGATWAFEVGSQSMICPIIVEDLSAPRQMLVEILCEEHGFFLEIADRLRGMGLTILKGVMESRTGSIWARFAVEAQTDVTRMDVFVSLMQFLEAAKINASNFNNGGHFGENTFQTATVP